MKKVWKLTLVEPNSIVCAGFGRIFARTAFREVAFGSLEELLASCLDEDSVDLILIDVQNNISPYRHYIDRLKEKWPGAKLVLFADSSEMEEIALAIDLGAHGLITKEMCIEGIIKTLELIAIGERIFPISKLFKKYSSKEDARHVLGNRNTSITDPVTFSLSSREVDVLKSLGEGMSNKEIALQLDISDSTVKVHVKAILRKLRMRNRTEAALWVSNVGILEYSSHKH